MNLIGTEGVPGDEHTNDDRKYAGWETQRTEEKGEWKFQRHRIAWDNFQMKLNPDNSVMHVVNFAHKEVKETGDPTKNIAFYLIDPTRVEDRQIDDEDDEPTRQTVCQDLDPNTNLVSQRLDEIGTYFDNDKTDDGAFWSMKPEVRFLLST